MSEVGQTVNAKALANLFNLTERRIQQLAKEGVIQKAERGKYPFLASIKAYVTYLQEKVYGSEAVQENVDISKSRARLVKANADMRELDLAAMKREYLPSQYVRVAWERQIGAFKSRALAVPVKMAASLHGVEDKREIERLSKAMIYEALQELSEIDDTTERDIIAAIRGPNDDNAASGSGDGSVGRHIPEAESGEQRGARTVENVKS